MNKNNSGNCFVTVDYLKTMPASCCNRDDSGTPKHIQWEGPRQVVSSQAIKKAQRDMMKEYFNNKSTRTKDLRGLLKTELGQNEYFVQRNVNQQDTDKAINVFVQKYNEKMKKDAKDFMRNHSEKEISLMTGYIAEHFDELLAGKCNAKSSDFLAPTIMESMFGRMDTVNPEYTTDGALYTTFGVSTNQMELDTDFFTACDDFNNEAGSGAGHLESKESASSTFYFHSHIDVGSLKKHNEKYATKYTNEEIAEFIAKQVRCILSAFPNGRSRTMYANRIPDYIIVNMCHGGSPVTFSNPMNMPIKKNIVAVSIDKLKEGYENAKKWGSSIYTPIAVGEPCKKMDDEDVVLSLDLIEKRVYNTVLENLKK